MKNFSAIPYLTIENATLLDEQSIQKYDVSASLLMESAGGEMGRFIWQEICSYDEQNNLLEIIFFCGPGNNGGDGLVAARYLLRQFFLYASEVSKRCVIRVFICASKNLFLSHPLLDANYRLLQQQLPATAITASIHFADKYAELYKELFSSTVNSSHNNNKSDIVMVDALFGTGLSRPIVSHNYYGEIVNWIASTQKKSASSYVIALDIPSGLNCKNSKHHLAVQADLTLTVEAYKDIFFYPKYQAFLKKIKIIPLDFPVVLKKKLIDKMGLGETTSIIKRSAYQHKLSGGKSLVCGGSKTFAGAAELAIRASISMGCGYLVALSPTSVPYDKLMPQLIRLTGSNEDCLQAADCTTLKKFFSSNQTKQEDGLSVKNILFGPGVDRQEKTTHFLEELLLSLSTSLVVDKCRLIIDADGLFHLKRLMDEDKFTASHGQDILLTPHFGEFQRLIDIQLTATNFLAVVKNFATTYNVHLLVKDVTSLLYVNQFYWYNMPSAFLGKAGSGDILAGMLLGASSYADNFISGITTALQCYYQRAKQIEQQQGANAAITHLSDWL